MDITNYRNKIVFRKGIKDGIPIALGYFAVSFSLGIAAKNAGLNPFQAFLASLLNNASAGEYAGLTSIAAQATYLEIAMITLIINARYLLMSFAMSQRISPSTTLFQRLFMGFYVTDEFFGISIARPGHLNPYYTYGAVLVAAPCWAIGTALGTFAGNVLPLRLVSAFSVAIYGMFLAIFIPPARKDKVILMLVTLGFLLSFLFSYLPVVSSISEGTRTIILTVLISSLGAILFPVRKERLNNGT